ncbi:MAG: magnesium and cobalt transport protein CorA [Bacteroidetes bacterium]|nr:MAG: magnesium and cobalt transport protein CorA [Bacteroidota bacterium]PTM09557.1 MAG: magnesium and cobalt transport protein CorA [Bacteroidota bacterium]
MKKKQKRKIGAHPGAVVFTGNRKVEKISIHYLEYNEATVNSQDLDNQSITSFHEPVDNLIQWYDVRGLHDTALIEEFGRVFNVHPLALEDVADTQQRPKLDEYPGGIFITIRALRFIAAERRVESEHIALYMGPAYVLSFQENEVDCFNGVRERILAGKGRIRKRQADYLVYALMDAVIDQYYTLIDEVEEAIEALEKKILENPDNTIKSEIHSLKQEMLLVRRSIAPLREVVTAFDRLEGQLVTDATAFFIRDLRDHIIQIVDLVETYRDMLNSLHDLYLSELSYRMNNVMQVLTVISTIFIPLSFLAGVYGMNFDYMPELHWRYSYFILLAFMTLVVVGMLSYFRRKRWF